LSYLYELPFGQGKHFAANFTGPAERIIGGWQVGGITTVSTGGWFTVTGSGNSAGAQSDGQQRPDQISNPNGKPCLPGTFFNTCAFVDPPLGSFGSTGRNTLRGPGLQIWDFSVFKNFHLTENKSFEFRSEFFNVFNHPNLQFAKSGPQNSINTTTFGTPQFGFLTAARPPRQIQFALKFYYCCSCCTWRMFYQKLVEQTDWRAESSLCSTRRFPCMLASFGGGGSYGNPDSHTARHGSSACRAPGHASRSCVSAQRFY